MGIRGKTTRPHLAKTNLDLSPWGLELITWKLNHKAPGVLLVPGHFCPRSFWIPAQRNGFADELATIGLQPFVIVPTMTPSIRLSRKSSDWAFRIIPSALSFIAEQSDIPAHALGYSAGGAYLLAAQALQTLPAPCRSITLIGTQLESGQPGETRFAQELLSALGRLSVQLNGGWLGYPESHNTAAELSEYVKAKASRETKGPLAALVKPNSVKLSIPLLALTSLADRVAPLEGCRDLFQRIETPTKTFDVIEPEDPRYPVHHHTYFSRRHRKSLMRRLREWMVDDT